jgi:hypothetical protein
VVVACSAALQLLSLREAFVLHSLTKNNESTDKTFQIKEYSFVNCDKLHFTVILAVGSVTW